MAAGESYENMTVEDTKPAFRVYTHNARPARPDFRSSLSADRLGHGQNPQRFRTALDDDPFTQTLPTAATLMVTVGAGRPY